LAYQVRVINFEGPLDLLLQLVERSQLEITEISLTSVTEQYLGYLDQIEEHEPADLGQFIELAARLMYIKSLALLPDHELDQEPEVIALREELADYQRYRDAAGQLDRLLRNNQTSYSRRQATQLAPQDLPLPDLTVTELANVFTAVLQKLPPASQTTKLATKVSLEEMMNQLLEHAAEPGANLQSFLEQRHDRQEIVVAFLALLELTKAGRLSVRQDKQFGDMILSNESPEPSPVD
jgi:segregation and condensation protein A